MNTQRSTVEARADVRFPPFAGERHYMRRFTQAEGLPCDLKHWTATVEAMLEGIDAPSWIYLMIDQAFVPAGALHRRPGLHIDGYWVEGLECHGGQGGHGGHNGQRGGHRGASGAQSTADRWAHCDFSAKEALILASNVEACRAYAGEWSGIPGAGGDCQHIDVSNLEVVTLAAGRAYVGNVTMLHESLPVQADCFRTLVRLNVPGV